MNKLFVLIFLFYSIVCKAQSFDPALAARLQQSIDSMRLVLNVKGISAGVYHPEMGSWQGVSGISQSGTPIGPDMQFGIASNTKLFTGVLMLKLAENNLISLEDSLHEYLPAYNNIDSNITIRQLLNHTSGLDDVSAVPGYPDSMLNDPNRIFTAAELVGWAGAPSFSAGNGWEYCNTNYLLAAMIAEAVSGSTYAELLRDSILAPLGLDSTFLDVYETVNGRVAHPWQNNFDNFNIPRTSVNSAAWSAGGMYSNSSEMLQWYNALMNGQVLNSNSMTELTTFVGSGNYSMGIAENTVNNRTVWFHGGSIWGGYNSTMMYDTTSGIVICVLINQFPSQAFLVAGKLLSDAIDTPLGINNEAENSFSIYPNPSKDILNIDVSNQQILSLKVFNRNGALLLQDNQSQLSIYALPAGTYFIEVETEKGVYRNRFVKG
jgi:CubicO group peptidase (beta-lactamase class C family)